MCNPEPVSRPVDDTLGETYSAMNITSALDSWIMQYINGSHCMAQTCGHHSQEGNHKPQLPRGKSYNGKKKNRCHKQRVDLLMLAVVVLP